MKLEGILQKNGVVLGTNNKRYRLSSYHTDNEGYPCVLIDTSKVDGKDSWATQSIKPFIGMKIKFFVTFKGYGYNYQIIKNKKEVK